MDFDTDIKWSLWCGNEGRALILGPFATKGDAERDAAESGCSHHHSVWPADGLRIVEMVTKMGAGPGDVWLGLGYVSRAIDGSAILSTSETAFPRAWFVALERALQSAVVP